MASLKAEDLAIATAHSGPGQPFRVQIWHIPSGLMADVINESSLQARDIAMRELAPKVEHWETQQSE